MSALQIIVGALLLLAAFGSFWLPYWIYRIKERRLERHAERRRQQRMIYRLSTKEEALALAAKYRSLNRRATIHIRLTVPRRRPMATYIEPRNLE